MQTQEDKTIHQRQYDLPFKETVKSRDVTAKRNRVWTAKDKGQYIAVLEICICITVGGQLSKGVS